MRLLRRLTNFVSGADRQTLQHHNQRQEWLSAIETTKVSGLVDTVASLLRPNKTPDLRWFGSTRDGGYALVGQYLVPGQWGLSIGVGEEISADICLARAGVRLHLFDPYVEPPKLKHRNLLFHDSGLGDESNRLLPLEELIELCNEPVRPSILMLDIEGGEWVALNDSRNSLESFDQIVVELHGLGDLADSEKSDAILGGIRKLTSSHFPVFWRANNHGPLLEVGGRYVPDVLELSFVKNNCTLIERAGPLPRFGPNSRTLSKIPLDKIFEPTVD